MAEKGIVWTHKASLELQTVLDYYIARHGNLDYSYKILIKIDQLFTTLLNTPYLGRITSNKRTRVIHLEVYLIFYEINDDKVEILSFWDNRQSDSKRLKL